jgi:hypothetical protein
MPHESSPDSPEGSRKSVIAALEKIGATICRDEK